MLAIAANRGNLVEKQGDQALTGSADEFPQRRLDGHAPVMALVDLATPGDVAAIAL